MTLYWRNSIFDTVIYFSVNYNRYLRKNKLSEINVAQVCNLANYFDINNLHLHQSKSIKTIKVTYK